jgi:hypothetical protein
MRMRMKLRDRVAAIGVVLLAASCERSAEQRQPAVKEPAPASTPAPAKEPEQPAPPAVSVGSGAPPVAAPQVPRMPQVPPSGSASDDLPHRRRELAWLAKAKDCVPPHDPSLTLTPHGETLSLALDSYDGKLVLCAQAITRRDVSVFFDFVSYACWNVDPATAAVSARADLGRAHFRCQDGACSAGDRRSISHDGTEVLVFSEAKGELSIVTRPGGAPVRSFPSPPAFAGQEFLRGQLTLVGHTIFGIVDSSITVLDDRGAARGTLEGRELQVVDAGRVLVIRDEQHATLYELATRRTTPIALTAPYIAGAVQHGGAYFAVDGDARKLVLLDGKTLQPKRTLPLRLCPRAG